MYFNPQTRELLEKLSELRTKPVTEISVDEARQHSLECSKLFSGQPEEVAQIDDFVILGPNGDIPLRIYSPKSQTTNMPAMLYFFSGGFVWGSIEAHDVLCRSLANSANCKIISVAYRLAPEHKYPIGFNDCYFATKWVFNQAQQLGIDNNKIAVSGYSSGGNYAALVAIKARNENLPLSFQVLMCPWLDLSCSSDSHYELTSSSYADRELLSWFIGHYLPENANLRDANISPLWEKNLTGLAPALVITAEHDSLREEGKIYANKLEIAGVNTIYSCYKGQVHSMFLYRGELGDESNPIDQIGSVLKNHFSK